MKAHLTDAAFALGWSAVKHMPEPVARRLFERIGDVACQRRGGGVLRLEANLRRVVPGASPERLGELTRDGMRSYMRYWMESFRLPVWSAGQVRASFDVKDIHLVDEAMDAGKGAVLALPHMANWDLAGAWIADRGHPFTTVAERLKPEKLFDRFVAYREGLGMEVLAHTGGSASAFGTMARRLRDGRLVCLVSDRDLSRGGIDVEFFGEKARMPAGPAALALQTGAALLPVTLWYDASPTMRGRVHPQIEVPARGTRDEKIATMTQALADVFREGIAEHPEDWHMLQRLWLADLRQDREGGLVTNPGHGGDDPQGEQ